MLACDQALAHRFSAQAEQFSSARYRPCSAQEVQDLRVCTEGSSGPTSILRPSLTSASRITATTTNASSSQGVTTPPSTTMYTESDSPAKMRKMSPSPMEASISTTSTSTPVNTPFAYTTPATTASDDSCNTVKYPSPREDIGKSTNSASSYHHIPTAASEDHGSEAPPHPSPEVLPPASAAHAPQSPMPSSPPQQQQHHYSHPQSPSKLQSQSPQRSPNSPRYTASPPTAALRPPPSQTFPCAGPPLSPPGSQRSASYAESYSIASDQANIEQHQVQQHRYQATERLEQHVQSHSNHDRGQNSDSDSTSSAQGDSGRRYRELVPEEQKDLHYWEKRRKNNEAARKSREKRRIHDMVLEGRITSLESANTRLRRELISLKQRYNLPDSFQLAENEEEDLRETGYKSDSVPHPTSPHRIQMSGSMSAPTTAASPPRQPPHQHQAPSHHRQPQQHHRLSLDSVRVTPPVHDLSKTRSFSFSSEHHHTSRPLPGSPLDRDSHSNNNSSSFSGSNSKPASRTGQALHSSPPPLLAIAGAVPMGLGRYPGSSNPGLPTFLSEASRQGDQDGTPAGERGRNSAIKSSSSSLSPSTVSHQQHQQHYFHQHHSGGNNSNQHHQHQQQRSYAHLPGPALHIHHQGYNIDTFKHEPMEEGEVRSRERSHSSVERRPSYLVDHASETNILARRSSLGNYNHCQSTLSPQGHHPYLPHHTAYPGARSSPGRTAGSGHYLQHRGPTGYESFSHSQTAWAPRSPISSHSSDENYDEPLQLTVRRESGNHSTPGTAISNSNTNNSSTLHHQHPTHDDSSRDSDSMHTHPAAQGNEKAAAPLSSSPPSASLPLKIRHKLPASHEFAYPKDFFPNMASAAVSVTQPSFQPTPHPHHHNPFMNGLAHLSDMAFPQASPLSLIKTDNSASALTYRHQSRRESRSSAARRAAGVATDFKYLDPKYLERRRRNNEAARKCRENRKTLTKLREAKSDYLESENGKLREELGNLQEEMKQLRELIEKKRLEQGIKEEDLYQQLQQSHVES